MTKTRKLFKKLRCRGLKETGMNYKEKFGFTDSEWQNIFAKVKKSSIIGIDQKNLIFVFG